MTTNRDDFFFNSRQSVVELETLTIAHPNFSQTYRFVRNATNGLTTVHLGAVYLYIPMEIKPLASVTDLDQEIQVNLGDLGEDLATELENIAQANGFGVKPTCTYMTFRSDDTSAPMFGPVVLLVEALALSKEGASFKAKAASFTTFTTGEIYDVVRFPMLETS